MASMTITIPDTVIQRVLDAVASQFHYNSGTDGTKAQFAKQQVINFIINTVKQNEASSAANTAAQTAISNVNSQISLT